MYVVVDVAAFSVQHFNQVSKYVGSFDFVDQLIMASINSHLLSYQTKISCMSIVFRSEKFLSAESTFVLQGSIESFHEKLMLKDVGF